MGTRLERLQETFGLDLRSLGVLRMLIGVMLLVDYGVRAVTLRAHYTDFGIIPTAYEQARVIAPYPGRFSFHLESGDLQLQVILLIVSLAFAVSLLIGYRTKISLLACLVLMISIQNRNMEIETGGDYLLRLIAFWGLFLPLGARFSLDARAGRAKPEKANKNYKGNQYFSVATVAVLIQMFIVYFFSALHKTHPIWRVHDTAIHFALHIDAYDTWLGSVLREYPVVTGALTRLTLGYEFVAPWVIFGAGLLGLIPRFESYFHPIQGSLRTLVSASFVLFHLGLASSLSLGTFAWFAALIWLGLFPTWAWDRLQDFRKGVPPVDPYEDKSAKKEEELPWLYKLRTKGVLSSLTAIERWFHRFETPTTKKKRKFILPRGVRRTLPWLSDAAAGIALFYVVMWNAQTVEPRPYALWINGGKDSLLPDARPMINFLRLDQHWGLFAPYPRTTDGYYVVLGKKKSGEEIDYLRDDHKVTWEKPDDVSGSYETFRWRKYFRNIRRQSKREHLAFYSNYVCREWNSSHNGDEALDNVSIFFMARTAKTSGGYKPTRKERLWMQSCANADRPYGVRLPPPRP